MADRVHGGARDPRLLDYSANINPLGVPASVREALIASLDGIERYPDPDCADLVGAISRRNQCDPAGVVCGNGAVELIFAAMHALGPVSVSIAVPSFCEYQLAARSANVPVELIPPLGRGPFLDYGGLADSLKPGGMGIVCSPNNPTGEAITERDLARLLGKAAETGASLLIDEAFIDFMPDWADRTASRFLKGAGSRIMVLRSLTKFHAIPGVRLGYALTDPDTALKVKGAKDPWSVNTMAQFAGVAALADNAYGEATLPLIEGGREYLYRELARIKGLEPVPGASANFVMVGTDGTGMASTRLVDRLRDGYGVALRDCASFDGLTGGYVRLAVRGLEENQRLVAALSDLLGRDC